MPSAILWLHAQSSQNVPGIALDQLELHNVKAEAGNYNGKPAVRVDALPDAANGASYAILKGSRFHNGTIEVELAGKPGANAGPGARGFIGIAFRVQGNCGLSLPEASAKLRQIASGVKGFKQTDAVQNLEAFGLGQFVQRNEWLALPTTKK